MLKIGRFALQVKHDNERHRAEAEHLRRIAVSEAERAANLEESNNTLETLGLIGRGNYCKLKC